MDDLFVFSVILTSFVVPREHQREVLQFGIVGALILRFTFILVGATALNYFTWLFFAFGAFRRHCSGPTSLYSAMRSGSPSDSV